MDFERRTYVTELRTVRESDEAPISRIEGHAALFNSLSENLGGFYEQIEPGAFDDALEDDVRALFNHDPSLILGRTAAGTLRIGVDKQGLTYEVDLPDTQLGRDLAVSMERGDVTQSSFGFTIDEDSFDEDDDGRTIRTIYKVGRLYDVSPVTYPAYAETDSTVAKRRLDEYLAELINAQGMSPALARHITETLILRRRHRFT